MSNQEDDEIREERERRCGQLRRGAARLENRARELILEAAELRKLAVRLEDINKPKPDYVVGEFVPDGMNKD